MNSHMIVPTLEPMSVATYIVVYIVKNTPRHINNGCQYYPSFTSQSK